MKKLFSVIIFLFCLTSCSDSQSDRIASMSAEELAYNFPTLFDSPPPQEFIIDTEKDTVIFGKSGVLLAIEAGTFTDENGNPLKGKLTLNLKEALSLSEMLENKLTTQTQDGQILQSGGMFEFTAKSDTKGKVNISKPIHAEVPTLKKIGDMSVYEGVQVNENAPVQWKKEKELENWLTEIPLEQLDFFPPNKDSFEQGEANLIYDTIPILNDDGTIGFFIKGRQISYNQKKEGKSIFHFVQDTTAEARICGISKYILEGLSDKKFQGTFISTYEFEKRLKVMNQCCGNDLIAIYLKNLDKNLWESDKLAAEYLTENKKCRAYLFEEFAAEKSTKVKPKEKTNRALQKHIDKLFKNKEKAWAKFEKDFKKWDNVQAGLLEKMENERRFAERLNYSFDLEKFGWVNIDMPMTKENRIAVTFDIKVKDLKLKEAGRVFLIFPNEKTIIDLSRSEEGDFYGRQENEDVIYLPKGTDIILKAVTERNKQLYTGELDLIIDKKIKKTIEVTQTTDKKVASRIKKYEQKVAVVTSRFVNVAQLNLTDTTGVRATFVVREDLSAKKFEELLEKHAKNRPVLDDYSECCETMDLVRGKELFEDQCKQCHAIHTKLVGPALRGSEARWGSRRYLIEFIKYPAKTIMNSRETDNIYPFQLYKKYDHIMPNYNHLSNTDIISILDYIEKESRNYSYSDFKEK